jgi:hypothetical protein
LIKNKNGTYDRLGAGPARRQTGAVKPAHFAALALLPFAACGPKHAAPPKVPPAQTAAQPPGAASPTSPPKPAQPLPGLGVIRELYKPSLTPFPDNPANDPFFTEELARALKRDSHPGEVGAIDFDYRYGAQDVQVSEVTVTAVNTADGERATARFDNIGKPYVVNYDLTLTRQGWRIADVSAPAQQGDTPWDLRQMLKLPPPDSEPPRRP